MRRIFLTGLLLGLCTGGAFAQEAGQINGVVVDTSGAGNAAADDTRSSSSSGCGDEQRGS